MTTDKNLNIYFPAVDWDKLVQDAFERVMQLSKLKGEEYSGTVNRLENFRRNANNLDLHAEQVWAVYAAKHWDALMQYVNDTADGKTRLTVESLSGRIDDLIVYLLLFEAMHRARLKDRGE